MLIERLRWAFVGLAFLAVAGTGGYRFIEGWTWLDSAWMVLITLTTIGYGEVHELSDEGRLYTVGLILIGFGVGTYAAGTVSQYLFAGEFLEDLRNRRRKNVMLKLDQHVVVVGNGRLGREVTAELIHRGRQVVVIEPNAEARSLGPEQSATLYLEGDGSDDSVLERAAIDRAQAVAVATGSDATNIFVTLSVRQMNPEVHIITRVDDERSVEKAIRAGANDVINPYGISGGRMAQGILHPHAAAVLDQALERTDHAFQIVDVPIGDAPEYHGALGELGIPERHGIMILALRTASGQMQTALDRDTYLGPGDVAVVVGQPEKVEGFALAASGQPTR